MTDGPECCPQAEERRASRCRDSQPQGRHVNYGVIPKRGLHHTRYSAAVGATEEDLKAPAVPNNVGQVPLHGQRAPRANLNDQTASSRSRPLPRTDPCSAPLSSGRKPGNLNLTKDLRCDGVRRLLRERPPAPATPIPTLGERRSREASSFGPSKKRAHPPCERAREPAVRRPAPRSRNLPEGRAA